MAQDNSVGHIDLLNHMRGLYPDMEPDDILRKLRAVHGIDMTRQDIEAIFEDFTRPTSQLNGPQRRVAAQLSHPTFLDLPPYFADTQRLRSIHFIIGYRDISLLDNGPQLVSLYFRLQPLRVQREIVQSEAFLTAAAENRDAVLLSELTARMTTRQYLSAKIIKAVGTDSPAGQEQTRAVLEAFREGKGILGKFAKVVQVIVQGAQKIDTTQSPLANRTRPDYFQRLSDGVAMRSGKALPEETRAWAVAKAEELNQPLREDEINALQLFPHWHVEEVLNIAVTMNNWLEERGQSTRISPATLFDTLHGTSRKGQDHDPLLMAWMHKFALMFMAGGQMVDATLEDLWRQHAKPEHKPANEHLLVQILRHAEFTFARNPTAPMCITLEALAGAAGLTAHQLRSAIYAESADAQQRACWRARKGAWQPTDVIKGLARVFHPATDQRPDLFFAQPAPLPQPVVTASAPAVIVPVAPVIETPKTPWEEKGMGDAEKLFGAQFETPEKMVDAVIALMKPERADEKAMRGMLFDALRDPKGAVRQYTYGDEGNKKTITLPSIPHMWLMWAAMPETYNHPSSEAVFTSLAITFDVELKDDVLNQNLTDTPQGTLAWAAITHARTRAAAGKPQNGVTTITSYRDFLRWAGSTEQREHVLRHQLTDLFGYMDELRSEDAWPRQMNATQRDGYYKPMAELLRNVVVVAFGRQGNEPKYTALLGPQRRGVVLARLQPLLSPEA